VQKKLSLQIVSFRYVQVQTGKMTEIYTNKNSARIKTAPFLPMMRQ